MTALLARRFSRRGAAVAASALLVLGAACCSAPAEPSSDAAVDADVAVVAEESPSPTPTSADTTSVADEMTCAAFGDVVTILFNAEVALRDGRMERLEQRGWYSIASRVLGNIPAADAGPVAEALAALKTAVPPVAEVNSTNFDADEGRVAVGEMHEACDAAGFQVVTNAFTGG